MEILQYNFLYLYMISAVIQALMYKVWMNLSHQPHVILDHFLNSDSGFSLAHTVIVRKTQASLLSAR